MAIKVIGYDNGYQNAGVMPPLISLNNACSLRDS